MIALNLGEQPAVGARIWPCRRQFDLWEPSEPIPVGHGQTRRGFVVTCCSGYSRAGAGALVFSKEAPDVLWGMSRCLGELGALPRKAVWDREGAIHRGGASPPTPSPPSAASSGSAG